MAHPFPPPLPSSPPVVCTDVWRQRASEHSAEKLPWLAGSQGRCNCRRHPVGKKGRPLPPPPPPEWRGPRLFALPSPPSSSCWGKRVKGGSRSRVEEGEWKKGLCPNNGGREGKVKIRLASKRMDGGVREEEEALLIECPHSYVVHITREHIYSCVTEKCFARRCPVLSYPPVYGKSSAGHTEHVATAMPIEKKRKKFKD